MTAVRCPVSDLWGARHSLGARTWALTNPDGTTTTLCSAACVISWLCCAEVPASIEEHQRRKGAAA